MLKYSSFLMVLIFLTVIITSFGKALQPWVPEIVTLEPNNQTVLSVSQVSKNAHYAVIQAHTQYKDVTLSLHPNFTMETSEIGSSIGILVVINGQTSLNVYLTSHLNITVNVLVFISIAADASTPVPGGCNLEFNMQNDPNIHIAFRNEISNVMFQWAKNSTKDSSCEQSPALKQLSYQLYVYYIGDSDWTEEAFFNGMKKMLTHNYVMKHGTKLKEIKYSSSKKPLFKLPSYQGQGTIYNVIVTHGNQIASYVPMTTYSCDLNKQDEQCHYATTTSKVLISVAGVLGLFLCVLGHKYFQTGNFLMAFCGFCVIFYLVLNISTLQSLTVIFVLSCILATVAGVLWLMLWWCIGVPVLSVLVPGFTAGYLFACVLFYTDFGNLLYWTTRYNYGMSFTVGVLILPVLILYWTRVLNILCCAFIGSFLITLTIDVWIEAGLKFIIVNTFRHAYIDGYLDVIVTGPFQIKDIILSCVWTVLFVTGSGLQFYRERGKPEFPSCPRKLRRLHRQHAPNTSDQDHIERDERSPLLRNVAEPYYSTRDRDQSEPT
ncbi:transmembrane 7 superfamily member 3-like isoform X1 [Mytilus trossulus]|uniref:transmembrane 7 superfamily member 3-like isoform X1 n=1 Tax=Mytilus trossulus TaxID=6551 RepID=UPI0030056245